MVKKNEGHTSSQKTSFDTSILLDNSPEISDDYQNEADILNYQINRDGVKNIAIVAGFGAGKSSAIETYLQKYKNSKKEKKEYTKVSLASFNDTIYNPGEIERSILQQLLYSRHKNLFPNSKIERTVKTKSHIFISILVVIFIASIALLGLQVNNFLLSEYIWTRWLFLGIIFLSVYILVIYLLYHNKFKKIKYKDFELETKDNNNDVKSINGQSLINRFVDEVLYFFECSLINLVIFEDLDRLEIKNDNDEIIDQSSAIFVKLRELNTIINNSHQQQGKQKVTFLYAIKDDLIKDQEQRGKFFEFILPIIPILNPVTTVKKILEIQNNIIIKSKELSLDSEFIHSIANRVPNMRILKNSFNDFIITRNRIFNQSENSKLKNENLFAICLYKNLFPFEYSLLEKKRGLIPLIVDKDFLLKTVISKHENEVKRLEDNINKSKEEFLNSFKELKMMFKGNMAAYSHSNSGYQSIKIDDIETFKDLDMKKLFHPYHTGYSINLATIPNLPSGDSYFDREEKIKLREATMREKTADEIDELRKLIKQYGVMNFNQLIDQIGIDVFFNNHAIASFEEKYKKLLDSVNKVELKRAFSGDNKRYFTDHLDYIRFLIQNSYIDENYIEYISSFQSELLSPRDVDYIKNVQQGTQDFDNELDNLENVTKMLRNKDFSQIAILNKVLLERMSEIEVYDSKKHDLLKKLINKNDPKVIERLVYFFQISEILTINSILKCINSDNVSFYETIISSDLLSIKKRDFVLTKFISIFFETLTFESRSIQQYFSESDNYLEILSDPLVNDKNVVERFLLNINPKMKKLNSSSNWITKHIIMNNYYEINVDNLKVILNVSESDEDFFEKNYEYIKLKNPEVEKFILTNMQDYVKNVLLDARIRNTKESSEVILILLKDKDIDISAKISIIEKYSFIISDISEFNAALYEPLLVNNRIKPDWNNIFKIYISEFDFNQLLKKMILRNAETLSGIFEYKKEISDENDNTTNYQSKLFFEIANYNYKPEELDNLIYVLKSIQVYAKSCSSFKVDKNLEIFIRNRKVSFNLEDLQYLIDKQLSLVEYIITFEKEIVENFSVFFSGIDFKSINKIALDKRISSLIKQKILVQFGDLVNINGFERQYFELIREEKIILPINFILKFSESKLETWEKTSLLEFTSYESNQISFLAIFLEKTVSNLNNISKKEYVEYKNGISERILKDYVAYKGYSLGRYRGKAIIKPQK